ncbi:MAG: hypothetical protein JO002_08145, partial [Burkholderiaceae bacterium]|nr:hypothetical protein [Burkholderiaceae bacterium]
MKTLTIWISSCALLISASCSKAPEQAAKPAPSTTAVLAAVADNGTPTLSQLMQAVFGKLRADGDVGAMLPDPDDRANSSRYLVHGAGSKLLPTGEAVLVAGAVPQDDKGEADIAHV